MKTYYYAWFEIIFKAEGDAHLLVACKTMAKFAFVKLESREGTTDDVEKIMTLLREIKALYELPIKDHDKEACENAGLLEYDFYELCYKLSIKMAKTNKEYDAEAYFDEAFMAESMWGYEDMFCYKLLEFATGADEDVLDMLEEARFGGSGCGFYAKS
jgi:hypothetical protein